jgi:hypothetical protein
MRSIEKNGHQISLPLGFLVRKKDHPAVGCILYNLERDIHFWGISGRFLHNQQFDEKRCLLARLSWKYNHHINLLPVHFHLYLHLKIFPKWSISAFVKIKENFPKRRGKWSKSKI